jgi:osmoprotectant transport system substrate-binding protein
MSFERRAAVGVMAARLSRRVVLGTTLGAAVGVAAGAVPLRVGSKLDIESALLAQTMMLALAAKGVPTADRLRLGTTQIVRAALLAGEIDLYPEYTGNGAFFFHQDADPVWKSAQAGYARVRDLDKPNGIVWLQPADASNAWAIALCGDVAAANSLATMEDFARWVRLGGNVRLAASAEFVQSPAALPAFEATYGFKLRDQQLLVLAGGETSAMMRAAAEGISNINAAMVYTTDGAIDALSLVVMQDTKTAQIVYAPAPVIREAALAHCPVVPAILSPVFGCVSIAVLRALNERIQVEGQSVQQVAREFLTAKGLAG